MEDTQPHSFKPMPDLIKLDVPSLPDAKLSSVRLLANSSHVSILYCFEDGLVNLYHMDAKMTSVCPNERSF